MSRLVLLCAIAQLMLLSGITSAQDRGWATSIAWGPDGATIAVGSSTGVWFFDSYFIEVGYVHVEHKVAYDDSTSPLSLAWNASGDLLAVSYPKQPAHTEYIHIISIRELEVVSRIQIPGNLWSPVVWHRNSDYVAGGTLYGKTYMWDALTGDVIFWFDLRTNKGVSIHPIIGICWFAEDVIVVANERAIYLVDIATSRTLDKLGTGGIRLEEIDCNFDNQLISTDGRLYDLHGGSYKEHFSGWSVGKYYVEWNESHALEWSPNSSLIVVITEGCQLRVVDGQTGEIISQLSGGLFLEESAHSHFRESIAWHPDGSRFAVVGQLGGIRVWDAESFNLLQRFDGFDSSYWETNGIWFERLSRVDRDKLRYGKATCLAALGLYDALKVTYP